jgi:hypothetical protein
MRCGEIGAITLIIQPFQTGVQDLSATSWNKFVEAACSTGGTFGAFLSRHTGDQVSRIEEVVANLVARRRHILACRTANQYWMALPATWTDNLEVPDRSGNFHHSRVSWRLVHSAPLDDLALPVANPSIIALMTHLLVVIIEETPRNRA